MFWASGIPLWAHWVKRQVGEVPGRGKEAQSKVQRDFACSCFFSEQNLK